MPGRLKPQTADPVGVPDSALAVDPGRSCVLTRGDSSEVALPVAASRVKSLDRTNFSYFELDWDEADTSYALGHGFTERLR